MTEAASTLKCSAAHHATALALLPDLQRRLQDPALGIFFVGSCAEGLSTSDSDIDLIVVLPGEKEQPIPEGRYLIGVSGGRRFEALLLREGEYRAQVQSSPGANRREWLHMMRKLLCGIPISGEDYARRLLQEGSVDALTRIATAYFHDHTADWFDSFCDFNADSRDDEALFCIRMSVSEAAESVLVLTGDLFFKEKWRIARVRRTFPRFPGLAPLTDFVCGCIAGSGTHLPVRDYAMQCSLAGTWLNLISLCPELLSAEVPRDWQRHVESRAPRLRPFTFLRRDESVVLLRSVRRGFEVSRETAKSIMCCVLSIPASVAPSILSFVETNLSLATVSDKH